MKEPTRMHFSHIYEGGKVYYDTYHLFHDNKNVLYFNKFGKLLSDPLFVVEETIDFTEHGVVAIFAGGNKGWFTRLEDGTWRNTSMPRFLKKAKKFKFKPLVIEKSPIVDILEEACAHRGYLRVSPTERSTEQILFDFNSITGEISKTKYVKIKMYQQAKARLINTIFRCLTPEEEETIFHGEVTPVSIGMYARVVMRNKEKFPKWLQNELYGEILYENAVEFVRFLFNDIKHNHE